MKKQNKIKHIISFGWDANLQSFTYIREQKH